jgi:4-hydroxy-4-methyl-2-oxoglutarate aldolase
MLKLRVWSGVCNGAVLGLSLCVVVSCASIDASAPTPYVQKHSTPPHSIKIMGDEERKILLESYEGLRVADVADAMDHLGLLDVGLMDKAIRPITPGMRICGIAFTTKSKPLRGKLPKMSAEGYERYVSDWYKNIHPTPYREFMKPGDVLVIDAGGTQVGYIGSYNSLATKNQGVRGIVIDGGCRDTYEVRLEKVPVYARHVAKTMLPGRMQYCSMMMPVKCGGVKVYTGDIIVADDDGVVVVPKKHALKVAEIAHRILDQDKKGRYNLYLEAGLPLDETVKE